jgi:tRNA A-37 threonylcarbamoyl transferase component Bud32
MNQVEPKHQNKAATDPTHVVDRLNKASLMGLALEESARERSGRAFHLPGREELAPLLPDLEILDLLGTGGMGCVYRARQPRLDRVVALKILPKELAQDEKFAERFAREARAMAKLNHPHIVRVYDFGTAGDIGFLVMEYMDGMNLRELLQTGTIEPAEAVRVFDEISKGLQFAHAEGVIHRDIKPENILFSRSGHVSLADFGLARLAVDSGCEVSLTQTRQAMGTLNYMAPEQWDNPKTVDHRADIYAMGILLYELLTGRVPRGSFPPASSLVRLPAAVDEVIHTALQVDPAKRFASVEEMNGALQRAISGISAAGEIDAQHQGTLTKVLHLGGLLPRLAPDAASTSGSGLIRKLTAAAARSAASLFNSHAIVCLLVFVCTFFLLCMTWASPPAQTAGSSVPGFLTHTVIHTVVVPNGLVGVGTFLAMVLVLLRRHVGVIRACLIILVMNGLQIALLASLMADATWLEPSRMYFPNSIVPRSYNETIAPYIVLGLLVLSSVETLIQLLLAMFQPVRDYVVRPIQQHLARKEEERKKWWRDRWQDARSVFGGGKADPPNRGAAG